MRPKNVLILIILGAVLLLSGCNWPGPSYKCSPADLVAPGIISPYSYTKLTDTTPTLWWSFDAITYPDPQPYPTPSTAYNCSPDKFQISLSTAPYFTDELGADVSGQYNWTTPVLQNGKTYRWSVVPIREEVTGPTSELMYFSIGELCSEAELSTPVLLDPPDGSTVQTLTPKVMYDTLIDCLPEGYAVDVSKDPSFASKKFYGGPIFQGYGLPIGQLENCETYYWRAVSYITSYGPYSDTWSFDVHLPNTLCQLKIEIPPLIPELIPSPPPDPSDRMWEVIRDAKCRLGPASAYPETGFLPIGHMAKILGRNEAGTWFRVIDPNGIACWGSIIAFDVPEGWETLEESGYDPLPTATPTIVPIPTILPLYNCAQHTDRSSCSAKFPVCIWDPNDSVCKNN